MKQSCSVYVAKKAKYCKEKVTDADGVSALDACPVTCSVGCACQDSTSWFAKKKSKNTCANYVAKKAKYVPDVFLFFSRVARARSGHRYCKSKVMDDEGVSAPEACPVTCGTPC